MRENLHGWEKLGKLLMEKREGLNSEGSGRNLRKENASRNSAKSWKRNRHKGDGSSSKNRPHVCLVS